MSGEPETEQANEQANEELVKQDSNMWEFEGPAEGEDAESPATNGQTEVKQEDKDGDMAMGDAVPANGGSKHASIPAPAKSTDAAKSGTPAQTQQGKQAGPKFGSGVNQGKPFAGGRQHRYFVLKSKSMFNVDASVEKGIWATQKHNEEKLNEAFAQKCGVYLIFSVNMSGHFQGYARMMSYVSRQQTSGVWEGGAPVGGTFKVEWKRRLDLPFESTHQMYNPLNEGKPVRICRDGQEVPHELGQQLTRMMDQMALEQGIPPPRPASNAMQPAGFGGPGGPPGGPGRGFGRGFRGRGGRFGPGRGPPLQDMHGGMPMDPMGMPMMMMGGPMGGFGPMPMGMRPPMDMMPAMGGFGGFEGGYGGMQGEMNGGFGGGFGRRPQPILDEPDMPMGPRRVMPGGYGSGREGYGGSLTVRARPGRPEDDYEADDWDGSYGGRGDYGRKRGRRESPPPSRSRRHRSRSESPVRRTSRRRRSRSRSHSRSRNQGADMGDLTYEQYLEAFEKMRRAGGSSSGTAPAAGNPATGGMNPMMGGMMGQGAGGGSRGPASGMPNGMAGADGGSISEEQYLRVWEQYSRMTGMPFDAQTVRGWYAQHRAAQGR